MPRITNCLWFDDNGEEAANFYVGVFPNSRINTIERYNAAGPPSEGSVVTVDFELDGTPYVALNGGKQDFSFNESLSFMIDCADQHEVDYYWERLAEGGEHGPCGWLKDRYGVSWQVIPTRLNELTSDPDPERARRTFAAMLRMSKLDIAELERAADGG